MAREPFEGSPRGTPRRRSPLGTAGFVAAALFSVVGASAFFGAFTVDTSLFEPELKTAKRTELAGFTKQLEKAEAARARRELESKFVNGVRRSTLEAIAECESHGDPRAVSSDGLYRGKYQFDRGTWQSQGGKGDPAKAPEAEQDFRAAILYKAAGSSPWPICGQ